MNFEIDTVRWKSRFPNAGVDPYDAYKEIEKIREKKGGKITDRDIVEAAKSKRNKLHDLFEWDNDKAADEYRLQRARTTMRALEVTYKDKTHKEPVRAYEVVQHSNRKREDKEEQRTLYSSFEEAVQDEKSREWLLADAIRQLMQLRRRFRMLNELDRVFTAIDEAVEEIAK